MLKSVITNKFYSRKVNFKKNFKNMTKTWKKEQISLKKKLTITAKLQKNSKLYKKFTTEFSKSEKEKMRKREKFEKEKLNEKLK